MRSRPVKIVHLFLPLAFLICTLGLAPSNPRFDLSFETRVKLQKTIEEVYWKNTIWPADNPHPKPALSVVISDSEIRATTEEYLRKSNSLEIYYHKPITPEKLQGELNRIAKETKHPALLRELWAALQNDPYLIAECFARPLLVNRTTSGIHGFEKDWSRLRKNTDLLHDAPRHHYSSPKINESNAFRSSSNPMSGDYWQATTTWGAPSPRMIHSAVWTGTKMIVFGGIDESINSVNTGGLYDAATNSWSATTMASAPAPRYRHSAIWTGTEMIIWGGEGNNGIYHRSGGRYNPFGNSWTATSLVNAPLGRSAHSGVWTGTKMIVWGGTEGNLLLNTGGLYDPVGNSWDRVPPQGAPAPRSGHSTVWTGQEMIVWGGDINGGGFSIMANTGGRYNVRTNSWSTTSTILAPVPRGNHTAVWTGTQMIVWGGWREVDFDALLNSGGRYNPSTNTWTRPPSMTGAPSPRSYHTAVWTGDRMIIWGGQVDVPGHDKGTNTGGRYDPSTDTWNSTTTSGAPSARFGHTAVSYPTSFGLTMLIWGGGDFLVGSDVNTGGKYVY